MSAATATVTRFEEISGCENVIADSVALASYEVDGRTPSAAVRAGSVREICEIVRLVASEKLALIVTGHRTKLAIGAPPARYDVALDVTRLNRILAYDPGDLTLGVEPGIGLTQVNAVLAKHGQFLPLAVPYMQEATIGGAIASGVDSPLRQAYGTARDFVLGMEFVTGEGVASKSGGRVVKNVTGYDVHKLLIGSLGTLAVITRVNFRTFPLPVASRAFLASFHTVDAATDLRARIARSPLALTTLEIFSPGVAGLYASEAAATIVPEPIPRDLLAASHWTLTTAFAGDLNLLDRTERALRALGEESNAARLTVLSQHEIPGGFGRKREFVRIALASSPAGAIARIDALPTRLKDVLSAAVGVAERNALPFAAMARGVGVIYAGFLPEATAANAHQRVQKALQELMAACRHLEAAMTIPWAPLEIKRCTSVWGPDRSDLELMRRVKKVFDPQDVLAPGRFAGGI